MGNTTQLKPVRASIDLIYECPQCKSEQWFTQEEAKTKGYKFICCGKTYVLRQVNKVDVKCHFVKKVKSRKKAQVIDPCTTKVVKCLMGIGYEKARAMELANLACIAEPWESDIALLVKTALAQDE